MTKTQFANKLQSTKPDYYGGKFQDEELWNLRFVALQTRDSEPDESRVEEVQVLLGELDDETYWTIERFNHWACGWVENLVLVVYDDEGNFTNAFNVFYEEYGKDMTH